MSLNQKNMRMRKSKAILLFLGAFYLINLPVFGIEKEFEVKHGLQWYPFTEWTIHSSISGKNPYDTVTKVIFTHSEKGDSITTSMFYDPKDIWKFRFTAKIPGEWTFKTQSEIEELDGWTGKVIIKENPNENAHGFMKSFGNKWGWEGTEQAFVPQYVMGRELRSYLQMDGSINMAMIEDDIEEFMEGHGFTGFHITASGEWFDGDNPDPEYYKMLETIIIKVHRAGGACHIWLWGSNLVPLDGKPMNAKDQRNLRYLAARLGPLPGWSMGYGYDVENGWAGKEQLDAWKNFLEEQMGWRHFLGARVGYDEKGLFAADPRPPRPPHDEKFRAPIGDEYTFWLGGDYIGYTSYRPLYDRYREAIEHRPEKPSFEEDRFRIRDFEGWNYKDYDEELTRKGLWHSVMAGGVANIWGNFLPQEEGIDYETLNKKGSKPYKIKDQIKTHSLFFENRFLKDFESQKEGETLILMTPGNERIIIYTENTDEINFQKIASFPKGPIIAVDTRRPYEELHLSQEKINQNWKAPYKSDWAIAIGDFPKVKQNPIRLSKTRCWVSLTL